MNGNIEVKPIRATLTRDTEAIGKMDCFVVFQIGSKTWKTTPDQDSGKTPCWIGQEWVTSVDGEQLIDVQVYDEDLTGDDFVGQGSVAVSQICKEEVTELDVPLQHEGKNVGSINIIFNWNK